MSRLGLILALLIFGAISVTQLDLPGLYYDEALDVVPTMQLLLGQPVTLERGVGVWVGSTAFPVMIMDYVGTVNTYLMLPFFALLGVNVYSLRLMTIAASLVTLVLAFAVGKRLFGSDVAILGTLLLAVHPSFVFWSRMGITVTSVMTLFSLGSLLAFMAWWDRRQARWFVLGCFLLGIGLWAKLLFLWWIVALAVTGTLLLWLSQPGGLRARTMGAAKAAWSALGSGAGPLGLLALIAGGAPLIWYNLVSSATVETLRRNLVTTEYGVNNFDIARNLAAAWDTFRILLEGSYFWYQGGPFANDRYLPVLLACAIGAVVIAAIWRPADRRALFAALAISGLIIAQSSVTVSGHWATHLFILYPFPQLVAAYFAVRLVSILRAGWPRVAGGVAAAAVVAALAGGDLYVDYQYQAEMNDTRGFAAASNGIYGMADYLDRQGITRPVALDWGFARNIQILTQGRVNPVEIFGYGRQADEVFAGEARKYLADRANLYLLHWESTTVYPRLDRFKAEAEALGLTLNVEQVFRQQDGQILAMLVSAR